MTSLAFSGGKGGIILWLSGRDGGLDLAGFMAPIELWGGGPQDLWQCVCVGFRTNTQALEWQMLNTCHPPNMSINYSSRDVFQESSRRPSGSRQALWH